MDGLLGYSVRPDLYKGEDKYFSGNPSVSGMASESGHIILNPYSPESINQGAVAKNEAFRLFMKDNNIIPEFAITNDQLNRFEGTPYFNKPDFLKQTLAARIYSGDPSANATEEQRAWVSGLLTPEQGNKAPQKGLLTNPSASVTSPNLDFSVAPENMSEQERALLEYHRDNLRNGSYLDDEHGLTTLFMTGVTGPDGRIYNVPGYFDGARQSGEAAAQRASTLGWGNYPSYATGPESNVAAQKFHEIVDQDAAIFRGENK